MIDAVWPSDPRFGTDLSIIEDDVKQLAGNKMLMTRLLYYLLQRGWYSVRKNAGMFDFEYNVCCGSTATFAIMESYTVLLQSKNSNASRSSISSIRKKIAGFNSGRHKLVFPHIGNLDFFVIVIIFDSSLQDIWLTVDCYDSL